MVPKVLPEMETLKAKLERGAGEGEEDDVEDSSCNLTVDLPPLDARVRVTA